MPDGKRNSITSGETEGENCFYNEDLQRESAARKIPLTLHSRGFHNLSDRLLKAMVANEVKKTLDAEDNKKLVAHHRPVLHSDNDNNDADMVVVGVVLNAKQSQNEEVSKAIDMLRRNGVSCVYFTLKDALGSNGTKKDETIPTPGESNSLPDECTKTNDDEYDAPKTPEASEASDSPEAKVSSPTVSTTSDYNTTTPDCRIQTDEQNHDLTCTSTTSPANSAIGESLPEPDQQAVLPTDRPSRSRQKRAKKEKQINATEPFTLPSPPLLMPHISVNEEQEGEDHSTPAQGSPTVKKITTDSTAIRRKKRRKRMYPYVSRRKSRNKSKNVSLSPLKNDLAPITLSNSESFDPVVASITPIVSDETLKPSTLAKEVDPYEFEESDVDSQAVDNFKVSPTPKLKKAPPSRCKRQKVSKVKVPILQPPLQFPKRRRKGSLKTSLTFSKDNDDRAFSPDITDHENGVVRVDEVQSNSEEKFSPTENCVQSISRGKVDTSLADTNTDASLASNAIPDDVPLVLPNGQCPPAPQHCDEFEAIRPTKTQARDKVLEDGESVKVKAEPSESVAQPLPNVQIQKKPATAPVQPTQELTNDPLKESLIPATNDSLPDTPDSMQLRRSSFYSSISRNVRTNLEKYLDGRPLDLKAPKKPKKIKNGFLLHHGDNFPDNPEAPYRLHLATQVLLKLNKRRVKCKPKDEKGKSLLSYLKLQPKRVSRVGKHSKAFEDPGASASNDANSHSVFSGDWTVPRKYICNICGQVENAFWDMVMHKGEVHPGIVVTHVELSDNPPEGFRRPPSPRNATTLAIPPACSKCSATFTTYPDLHRHIFECAGNAALLEDTTTKVVARKKKGKRKRGFKRRISGMPKKNVNATSKNNVGGGAKTGEITKRRYSEVFKCEFCTREFKTEGWLKNHVSLTHSLPISIPLEKLSLPSRASICSSRRFTSQLMKPSKQPC